MTLPEQLIHWIQVPRAHAVAVEAVFVEVVDPHGWDGIQDPGQSITTIQVIARPIITSYTL